VSFARKAHLSPVSRYRLLPSGARSIAARSPRDWPAESDFNPAHPTGFISKRRRPFRHALAGAATSRAVGSGITNGLTEAGGLLTESTFRLLPGIVDRHLLHRLPNQFVVAGKGCRFERLQIALEILGRRRRLDA
jgi:hypothetical protein